MSEQREIADQIKRLLHDASRHPVRFGLVVDIDAATHTVKVELQPEGDIIDFVRYVGPGIVLGNWRAGYLPALNAEVLLLATDPECGNFVAVGGLFNGVDQPPSDFAAGTVLLEHSNGTQLLLDTDGMIYIGGKSGAQPVMLQQWITDTFNSHTHPHPMGPTSPPTTPWSSGDVSTKFKGV